MVEYAGGAGVSASDCNGAGFDGSSWPWWAGWSWSWWPWRAPSWRPALVLGLVALLALVLVALVLVALVLVVLVLVVLVLVVLAPVRAFLALVLPLRVDRVLGDRDHQEQHPGWGPHRLPEYRVVSGICRILRLSGRREPIRWRVLGGLSVALFRVTNRSTTKEAVSSCTQVIRAIRVAASATNW